METVLVFKLRLNRLLLAGELFILILFNTGCGCREYAIEETVINGISLITVDYTTGTNQVIPWGKALPANALAVLLSLRDSLVNTIPGSGACSSVQPRNPAVSLSFVTIPGSGQPPLPLNNQLYVEQYEALPVPLAEFIPNEIPRFGSMTILCYGQLPVYGPQRWQATLTLADGTQRTALTPTLNLTR
jgi:hypothetical protein